MKIALIVANIIIWTVVAKEASANPFQTVAPNSFTSGVVVSVPVPANVTQATTVSTPSGNYVIIPNLVTGGMPSVVQISNAK